LKREINGGRGTGGIYHTPGRAKKWQVKQKLGGFQWTRETGMEGGQTMNIHSNQGGKGTKRYPKLVDGR